MRSALIGFVLIGTVACSQGTSPTVPTSVPTSVPSNVSSVTSSPRAVQAAPTKQVPLKGTFEGTDIVVGTSTPPTITTDATGTGTHVGRFSLHNVLRLSTVRGTGHWIAANGDTIETTFILVSNPIPIPGSPVFNLTENHTITGGTGRFTGAEGSFTLERTEILQPPFGAGGTHVAFGSFDGTITPPGAAH